MNRSVRIRGRISNWHGRLTITAFVLITIMFLLIDVRLVEVTSLLCRFSPSLLHCNSCGASLIEESPDDTTAEETEFTPSEIWSTKTLNNLIERRLELQAEGSLLIFQQNVSGIIAKLSPGNRKGLCESVGLQAYALNGWLNKDERPSMSVLLQFCYGVSVDVAAMFLPGAIELASISGAKLPKETDRSARPMLGFRQREEMRKVLEVIIEDVTDSRPLVKVAIQLGISRSALKYWFLSECRSLVLKKRKSEVSRLGEKYQKDHELLHPFDLTRLGKNSLASPPALAEYGSTRTATARASKYIEVIH